jgi:hypothetical protein
MLVPRLQEQMNIGLNGVILISPAINMGGLPFNTNGNDLTYVTHLPTLAATAWYHKKFPRTRCQPFRQGPVVERQSADGRGSERSG